ncbi:MAG: hypothetical protein ACRBDI_09725 [Alphaproteobacteria bacterium]
MSYIRKVTGTNEKLILITRLHWIYLIESILWFAAITGLGIFIEYMLWKYAGSKILINSLLLNMDIWIFHFDQNHTPIPWMFALAGFAVFWPLFSTYISTEVGLTDRRIIHKKGLIMIEIQQVELEDIRGEQVNHGWLGWLLGYGRLHFDCRFIDDVLLPAIRDPYRLVKAVHTARMRHDSIPYTIDNLDGDIVRIDEQRIKAFKAREKLKRLGRKTKRDFDKAEHQ